METGHEQGTSTRDLAGGAVEDRVPDDGRDRETPVGTDDIGGVDAGVERPERPASGRDDDDIALLPHDEGAGYQYRWQELHDLRVALQRYRAFFRRLLSA